MKKVFNNLTIHQFNNIEKIIGLLMLLFAVSFNLYLYRLEPTATVDPNDNAFQFGLVDRTNTMWDFATKKCSENPVNKIPIIGYLSFSICHFSFLSDHWVPNWADGFNLPYYYSHIPQIMIVGSWRFFSFICSFFSFHFSLFSYYHIVIYLLLCLFPVSVFLALRIMGFSWLTAGIGGIFATNLSTDGLYGLDPSSFLWRGYGLSSQLFAMTWFPLAIGYAYRYFTQNPKFKLQNSNQNQNPNFKKNRSIKLKILSFELDFNFKLWNLDLLFAVLFTTATTAGHLGIGMIAIISLGFLAAAEPIMKILRQEPVKDVWNSVKDQLLRLTLVAGLSIFLLSYWIVPTFIDGNYHNISFWDPTWKFNSYGVKETLIRLFNGDIFDFGRLPVITYLTILGIIVGLFGINKEKNTNTSSINNLRITIYDYSSLSLLFIFWLLFYFGRTTWGSLIDIIPGMKDFHLSRFIVGVHLAGMLLAPIGLTWLADKISSFVSRFTIYDLRFKNIVFNRVLIYSLIGLLLLPPVFQWTITYNDLNDRLIVQANTNHAKVAADEAKLFAKLRSLPPARIFAGRGGGYGKSFRVAETPYYMQLSTFGLPTTLWLPETWSMDSDTEQYFSEDQQKDYDLYNIRWIAAPPGQTPQPFWRLIDQASTWKLYETSTSGYFTTGVRAATVSITKLNFVNLVHLWIQSDYSKNGIFPELTFDKNYPKTYGRPNFKMTDEADYITPARNASQPANQAERGGQGASVAGGPDGLPAQAGTTHSLLNQPPVYLPPGVMSIEQFASTSATKYKDIKLIGPENDDTDMIFKTRVDVGNNCQECLVILKETYHPNWRAWVDGKEVKPIIVFPFFIGVPVTTGTHNIVVSYLPSRLKTMLLVITLLTVAGGAYLFLRFRKKNA
jgi:hypothetical protein